MFDVMLSSNADLHARDAEGNTAAHYAAAKGHLHIIKAIPRLQNDFPWPPNSLRVLLVPRAPTLYNFLTVTLVAR